MKRYRVMMCLGMVAMIDGYGMQSSFDDGKRTAEISKHQAEGEVRTGRHQKDVPYYREGVTISPDDLTKAFEKLDQSEEGRALYSVHKTRRQVLIDEKDRYMTRSEEVHHNPEKAIQEAERPVSEKEGYTLETCEECPDEEYFVRARKTKKRYVYLDKPPYITAGKTCQNHGHLTVKVEIVNEPDEIFKEDGEFHNINLIKSESEGATIDETYYVNGGVVVLRKTIHQNGIPWIRPDCYLVPALKNHVLSAETIIKKLLGGSEDEVLKWGEIGDAMLHHREVKDTGEHYWILDDASQTYENLCEKGLCEYHAMEEDPPTYKYWKGKKVLGSWGQTVTYACRTSCKDTCSELRVRGCLRQSDPVCLESKGGKCLKWRYTFKCMDRIQPKTYHFSKQNPFCLGGDCIDSSYESDKDLVQALGYLSILEEARKDLKGSTNIDVFKGKEEYCSRFPLSFKDCCKRKGWGVSLGLASCDGNSKTLARLREEGKCVSIGSYCSDHVNVGLARFCFRKKTVFCCFGSKFAKVLQEQGKKQLGQDMGTPKCPNCRGFTADELSQLDFSKLDLSEIAADVMDKFKPETKVSDHIASGKELSRIQDLMKERVESTETEARYLQENMKHLSGSMKTGAS